MQTAKLEMLTTDLAELRAQLASMETAPRDVYILAPGASRHAGQGVVLRYALCYEKSDTTTGFVHPRQGRYMRATYAETRQFLGALLANDPPDKLALYGGASSLYVAFQPCYGGHYDPFPLDLGSDPGCPADLCDERALSRVIDGVIAARISSEKE